MNQEIDAINISALKFAYNTQLILDIEAFHLPQQSHIFIYGRSGSGKSTLLNLLSGISKPQQGSIHILGQNLQQLNAGKRDKFRAQNIGVVFQEFNLIPYLSIWQNIAIGAHFGGQNQAQCQQHAREIFAQLELSEQLLSQKINTLSVGQRQRVAIARALINHPKLLIADEPTSALDSQLRDQFMTLLLNCCQKFAASLLFVSHDLSLQKYFSQHLDLAQINRANQATEQKNDF